MNQIVLTAPNRRVRGIFNSREDAREFRSERPDWTEDVLTCPKCGLELIVVDGSPHKCPHY